MILHPHFDVNAEGHLTIGGMDTVDLAKQYGTPAYILDEEVIRKNCRTYRQAAKEYFGDLLELAVGSQDGVPRKPAPDTVINAMAQLGVTAEETLYIGDSEVDVQTARNAGVDGLFVTWGFRTPAQLKEAGAEYLVDTVEELDIALR